MIYRMEVLKLQSRVKLSDLLRPQNSFGIKSAALD